MTATTLTPTTLTPTTLTAPVLSTITRGWHADPMAIHKLRWHDGEEWTGHVTHFGPVPCHECSR